MKKLINILNILKNLEKFRTNFPESGEKGKKIANKKLITKFLITFKNLLNLFYI